LFEAAEILAHPKPYRGPRLAIVSNGGGPAVMATDALIGGGGVLAEFSAATLAKLEELLPRGWSRANPIDIVGDATPERYVVVLEQVLEDASVDALVLIHAPTAVASAAEVAHACTPLLAATARPALGCWLGSETAGVGDTRAGVPAYATAEEAVEAFLHLTRYHQAQSQLRQAPGSVAQDFRPAAAAARAVIAAALAQGRRTLTEPEAKEILAAYQIPVVETRIARDADEAGALAAQIGFPVALKILSPDITHKSDVGGVVLDIESPAALQAAAAAVLERCRTRLPAARIEGFTVQRMVRRGGAQELLAGIAVDATFGPTIVFGQGGTAVELIADSALALPPLDPALARDLMMRTRVYRLLQGYRGHAPVDLQAIELTLIKLAQLAAEVAELVELDINPLLAGPEGVLALDARVTIAPATGPAIERLAMAAATDQR
jgi:acetyltransferase